MVRVRFALTLFLLVVTTALSAATPIMAQQSDRLTRFDRAPLLKEPTTPEEMFSATVLMVDLIRNDLALQYLEQFVAAEPDDETIIRLRNKYGVAEFLKLALTKDLQPLSTRLLERLTAVSKKQAEDPAFVDALLRKMVTDPRQREQSIVELRNAGVPAIPEMLKQMSLAEMAPHQDLMVIALTKMGIQIVPPLIGALESPQPQIRGAIIDVLGWLDAKEAIPYLWFPAFDGNQPDGINAIARMTLAKLLKGSPLQVSQLSSVEASNELRRLARAYFRNSELLPINQDGYVSVWTWDSAAGTVAEQTLRPELASLKLSAQFAKQSLTLSPEQPEPQRQYLASLLGWEVLHHGWDKPRLANPDSAMYLAMTAGEATVAQVLAEALEAAQPATAVAALEVLSQIGSREQLATQPGLKSPVIAALNSPDQRVQFAAATTILKLDPKVTFNGASRVVPILARTLTDPAQPRAIVIDSDKRRSTVTAGYLFDGGFEGIATTTGREGFEQAATLAGVNVIIVHVNCARWELKQTVANLRADARTAAIPLVIYGPSKLEREMNRLVYRSAPATFVIESATPDDFLSQLRPFLKNLKSPPPSALERSLQKNAAIYWLSMIGGSNLAGIFDVTPAEKELSVTADNPSVAVASLVALGSIATGSSQRRLATVATNSQADEIIRETAANQLAFHIQRHGLLLDNDHVNEVQTAWKETDNPRVKSALASVIGSLRPTPATVGERLRDFPAGPLN
jgi:hypothetical protein